MFTVIILFETRHVLNVDISLNERANLSHYMREFSLFAISNSCKLLKLVCNPCVTQNQRTF